MSNIHGQNVLPQIQNLVVCLDISNPATIINYADITPAILYDLTGYDNQAAGGSYEHTLTSSDGAKCLDNNGTKYGYKVNYTTELLTADFTWVIWLNADEQDATHERFISQDFLGFEMAISTGASEALIRFNDGGWRDTGYNMPLNTWTMISLAFDKGATNGCKFYANTEQKYQRTSTYSKSNDNLFIGGEDTADGTPENYDGRWGFFAMWKSSLTAGEISQVFNATRYRFGV